MSDEEVKDDGVDSAEKTPPAEIEIESMIRFANNLTSQVFATDRALNSIRGAQRAVEDCLFGGHPPGELDEAAEKRFWSLLRGAHKKLTDARSLLVAAKGVDAEPSGE